MRLRMTDLQRFAKKAINEETTSIELRDEIRRVLGPRSLTEGNIGDVVSFANERIDIMEFNGRRPEDLGFKTSVIARYARHDDARIRKLVARVLPENMISKFEFDSSASVRQVVAKRLPTASVKRMSKRTPQDQVIRECLSRRVLSESKGGVPTPVATEPHRMYHDERMGADAKQSEGPELSDAWYESKARELIQDYGIEANLSSAAIGRFCSSTKATSGVEIDAEKLQDAVTDLIEEHDDELIDRTLKETVSWLRSNPEEDAYGGITEDAHDPVEQLIETVDSASEYVTQANKLFKIRESFVPASLMKYRIGEQALKSKSVPCIGYLPHGGELREVDERALSTYVSHWNSNQQFAGEPIRISWFPHPLDMGKVGFKVELK